MEYKGEIINSVDTDFIPYTPLIGCNILTFIIPPPIDSVITPPGDCKIYGYFMFPIHI
jgi:hypothetical protein